MSPTAQALRPELVATAVRSGNVPGLGLGTRLQAVPFQCAISVLTPPVAPTAQALRADVAATLVKAARPAGFGLATCFQVVPFHRRISVRPALVPPTAQALPADVAATPLRKPPALGVGFGTRRQDVPFQCTIRVLSRTVPMLPTAQALRADVPAMPLREPLMVKTAARPVDLVAAAALGAVAPSIPASSIGTATTVTRCVVSVNVRIGPFPLVDEPQVITLCPAASNAHNGDV